GGDVADEQKLEGGESSGRAWSPQRGFRWCAGAAPRGCDSEEHAGEQTESRGEGESGSIGMQIDVERHGRCVEACGTRTREIGERAGSPVSHEQSAESSQSREQYAFGKELPNDSHASRSNGYAHSDLAAACCASGQQQVRDVAACDQQDKADD